MNIYLIDYIGIHCGMHYYLDAFKGLLDCPQNNVVILSNYQTDGKAFFKHQYKGSFYTKVKSLLINYIRLNRFIRKHPNDLFVYLTYGNVIDILFLLIVSKARYHMIDIHEAIAQHIDNKKWLKSIFRSIYNRRITTVITHSKRTNDFLDDWKYHGKRLFVPHFKYCFSKTSDHDNVGDDITASINNDKINLLFFGNITHAKGIDVLLSSLNNLNEEQIKRLNVIVAGKDADGVYATVDLKYPDNIKFILRHINDDELVYLYQNIDFIAMPYRKTSQSGILEMAFYFKKPIIASKIPYFEKMLSEFKSFGILSEGNDVETFTHALINALNIGADSFFNDADYAVYENREEIKSFQSEFNQILYNLK